MKKQTFELNKMGLVSMNEFEMQEIDGGSVLGIIGGALLVTAGAALFIASGGTAALAAGVLTSVAGAGAWGGLASMVGGTLAILDN